MPIMKRRWNYTKVYRPNGMKFADGRGRTPEVALAAAVVAFETEFGSLRQEEAVIEVVGVTGMWAATVFEIPEGKDGPPKTQV